MNIIVVLKKIVENIPYFIGRWLAYIPFKYRLGSEYEKFKALISKLESEGDEAKYNYTIEQLNQIVKYAQNNIPFYKELYGNEIIEIKSLKDFESLPTISKKQVREYSKQTNGSMQVNTGGSTGEPLTLYIDKFAWAREWAHMHYIWKCPGYTHSDLMVTLLGKNIGNKPFVYNAVHNEFKLNPYINAKDIAVELKFLFRKQPVSYFQGYPSAIYNFFKELEASFSESERLELASKFKCCFFSSEYPLPYMTKYLQETWGLKYISWYGHSEMCVLASDNNEHYSYEPLCTYGYSENVEGELVGTSFNNLDMPLIRYRTGDLIESTCNDYGMMQSFKITAGREGDFIFDNTGKKIPLTALVFGRHHEIFNVADYVQIAQESTGLIVFYITFKNKPPIDLNEVKNYFDLSNIQGEFGFKFISDPIRSKSGKLQLKVFN